MQAKDMDLIINIKVSLTFKKIEQAVKCVYTTNVKHQPIVALYAGCVHFFH